jgi:hypothetical protein
MGEGLRRAKMAAKATTNDGRDAYLVVCYDGEITGKFGNPASIVQRQAELLNPGCQCGGPHEVIRMVQTGAGKLVKKIRI